MALFRMIGRAGFQPRRQVGNLLTPNPLPLPKGREGVRRTGEGPFRRSRPAGLPFRACYNANLRNQALERSEEHTSELQSRLHLVCRLLLEKKKEGSRRPELR